MAMKINHEETKDTKRVEDRGSKIEDRFTRVLSILDSRSSILNPLVLFALLPLFASLFFIPWQNYLQKWNLFRFDSSGTRAETLSTTVVEIREEALRANDSSVGRPLPLAGHWNLGQEKNGFSPSYQMKMIEQGHYLLPWFLMPDVNANPQDPRWISYYEAPIKRAAELKLPVALVSTQWEAMLSVDDKYVNLPPDQNPNVVATDGKVRREVSPFGPVGVWREVGARWASSPMMKRLQEWYADPPLLLFVSNNEHMKLQWAKVEDDRRYVELFGRGRDDDFKRKVVGDGWIERYRAL